MKKRVLALLAIITLLAAIIAGCSSAPAAPSAPAASGGAAAPAPAANATVIKIAHYFADTHPNEIALLNVFKPQIEKNSNGRFVVETYPNNTLGAEKEFTEATRLGTVEACLASQMISNQFPIIKVANFPWIFDDVELGWKIMNSDDIRNEIFTKIADSGLIGQAFVVNGVRAISNSVRPINSLADCKGLKLRMPESDHFVDNGKALGFNVVSMAMSEIFTGLQQGVIDGQENPPTTLLTSGWYEVQKYVALVTHQISYDWIAISKTLWDKLPDADKKIIKDASIATSEEQLKLYVAANEADIKTLQEKGLQITRPDRAEFKAAGETVVQKYMGLYPDFKYIVEKVREKGAQLK